MNFQATIVTPAVTLTPLIDARVARRKPGALRREVSEGTIRGLYLVLQPSGVASRPVRYLVNGMPRNLTLDV